MTGDDLGNLDDAARRDLAGQMLASVFAAVDRRASDDLDEQDLYALVYDEVDAARAARDRPSGRNGE